MAKVSTYPTVTITATDYVYLVDDTGGTPASGKATVEELGTALASISGFLTDSSGTSLTAKTAPTTSDEFLIFDAAASEAPVTSTGQQVIDGLLLLRSAATGITGASRLVNAVRITQAGYDAITPDADTLYAIVG